jgi:hypothetical protein
MRHLFYKLRWRLFYASRDYGDALDSLVWEGQQVYALEEAVRELYGHEAFREVQGVARNLRRSWGHDSAQ